jgi:hypothetical protein
MSSIAPCPHLLLGANNFIPLYRWPMPETPFRRDADVHEPSFGFGPEGDFICRPRIGTCDLSAHLLGGMVHRTVPCPIPHGVVHRLFCGSPRPMSLRFVELENAPLVIQQMSGFPPQIGVQRTRSLQSGGHALKDPI